MYHALYRKYRPTNFDEVVGQNIIVKTLSNAIKNNKVSHAYLFSGPRGTGKTSIAKIFAKILNCENPNGTEPCNNCVSCTQINNNQNIDVIEIDAASNNGVDEIREIRNKISLVPTNSKYKIYIVDEVHMLTNQAFNALLKTLEEPPTHAIFIFATTEYYKIPKTILSRCQRFDFKKVSNEDIYNRLEYIAKQEKINIDKKSLLEIANLSDGGMRDAISLLDQVNSYVLDKIKIEDIHDINGTISPDEIDRLMTNFFNKNLLDVLDCIEEYDRVGKDIIKINQEIVEFLKQLLIYISTNKNTDKSNIFTKLQKVINIDNLYNLIKNFSNLSTEMKKSNNVKILFEIEIIKNINIDSNKIDEKIEELAVEKINELVEELPTESITSKIEKVVELNDNLKKIKEIRINNSLVGFSRKIRDDFKEKIEELKPLLMDPKYSKHLSLLLDGELKAISNNYFTIMYSSKLLANEYNNEIDEIDKTLKEILKENYKSIAVDSDEWEIIKNDYAKNKNNYVLKEEPEQKKNKKEIKKNEIEQTFDDIIEYS